MSRFSRRQFIGGAAAIAAEASLIPTVARAGNAPTMPGRPRALVQFLLRGGMDAILTTDPKTKKDVRKDVDLPYEENAIKTLGPTRIGPLLEPLSRFVPRMAILNGVVCSTVAHPVGVVNTQQMRRTFPANNSAGLSGTIGTLRLGDAPVTDFRYDFVGDLATQGRALLLHEAGREGMLEQLGRIASHADERAAVEQALAGYSARCTPRRDCFAMQSIGDLVSRLPKEPLPAPPATKGNGGLCRDIVAILKHRLSPAVFVNIQDGWDSHASNLALQTMCMANFAPTLECLLDAFDKERTVDGVLLADEVGIVISSELGRFPIKNEYQGKDHFPEFPAILIGPGIRPGQYGETDKFMMATPVSLETGRPRSSPKDAIPNIDDLGATVLHWFGIEDPTSVGYLGRRLDFLLR